MTQYTLIDTIQIDSIRLLVWDASNRGGPVPIAFSFELAEPRDGNSGGVFQWEDFPALVRLLLSLKAAIEEKLKLQAHTAKGILN